MKRVILEEMLGFNHTLAGCLAAAIVPAPVAPIVAVASHFVLDAFPHFGEHPKFVPYNDNFKRLLITDGLLCVISLSLGIFLFPHLWWLMILCAFSSTLPDFLWPLEGKVKWLNPYFKFHHAIQWGERPWGWILDILYALIFTTILIYLS